MAQGDAIAAAQAALLDAGLINLAIIDAQARVIAVEGSLLADWRAGDSVVERLLVLAGMEPVIAAMAKGEPGARPLDLPAVFIGGNHEDGGPGVSLRLAPLDLGRVLLLLRPLENAAAMDQVSVQQHNDLALLRGQLEQATSQAALNETAREALFDTLRWSFRAPLAGLVQACEGTALDGPARGKRWTPWMTGWRCSICALSTSRQKVKAKETAARTHQRWRCVPSRQKLRRCFPAALRFQRRLPSGPEHRRRGRLRCWSLLSGR